MRAVGSYTTRGSRAYGTHVATVVVLALAAFMLTAAPSVGAEGASGHIYALANSEKLEGRAQINYECEAGAACEWFGAASAYAEEAECPEEIEASHRVWSGALRRSTGTAYGRFSFLPEAPGGATLCLYLNLPLEEESELLEAVSETVAPPAPHTGRGSGKGTPPAHGGGSQPTPGGQSVRGPSAATLARVYRPFRANGTTTLRTHARRGYCWTGSASADRRDAWRCISGNLIADPCFSASMTARSVVCPSGPWSHSALRLQLTRALPRRFANRARPSLKAQPWAIELTDGRRALFASGASEVVEGERLNYFFGAGGKEGLWGYPDRGAEPWTILVAPFGAQRLSARASIRRAWM